MKWQPIPVLLSRKFHGWRSLVGYSPWGCKKSDTTEQLHFHFHLVWSSGFPYFLPFKPRFFHKELMIWATDSSRSCFHWLYIAFPSWATKNIINLISVLTIWWCSCVEAYLGGWKKVFAMTSMFSWENSVSLCPASFCTPSSNLPVISVSPDFLLLDSNPLWWKGHLHLVLVLEDLGPS